MAARLQEEVVFSGKIGEVVHAVQPDGRVFERYRRAPGTRLIIRDQAGKILITKEHRQETDGVDFRLPGGKVCDTLAEYHALLESGADVVEAAKAAAIKEAREEVGLLVRGLELVTKASAGATVEWDLYYFLVTDYEPLESGQQLEHGEDITITWLTPEEIRAAIQAGQMQEWRSVGVLLGKIL